MPLLLPELAHPLHAFRHCTVDFSRRILVMAVVNRTPDSFFDDGATFALDAAVSAARQAVSDGAEWVDVGGAPFAPGPAVPPEQEAERIVPVIRELRRCSGPAGTAIISADTFHPAVAERALEEGADVINDTTGLSHPDVARVVAEAGAHLVITHSLARPRTPYPSPSYTDVVTEVATFLHRKVDQAVSLGVPAEKIIVDPGHDLNKNTLHSLELTRRFEEITALGFPALAAVSNKDFIGETLDQHKSARLAGSLAAAQMCIMQGARIIRMHQVGPASSIARMSEAVFGWREPMRMEHNMGPANAPADRSVGLGDAVEWEELLQH
ncbi:dihydropteroate synthase [Microbacterium sp. A93]|uniref:dihydropteroate synthase n=1 Tax=Microbacterium sp. A93 TaxID=3450716 RepID=UPI003F4296BF